MSIQLPHIVILGAGPAGLGAAYRLASEKLARVTVLEQSGSVGGNAASFELDGLHLDYGSHRLHSSCDQHILDDIKSLLGDDLLIRPRHGRIRLQERWIHFPLKPADLVLKMNPAFSMGVFGDLIRKMVNGNSNPAGDDERFSTVLLGQLGPTICEGFYFPYSRKIWGLDPDSISGIQAKRRVSGNSVGKILRKVLSTLHKGKENNKNYFYYPRYGFGQISGSL
ncbi:MAG: NAD(P)-binding protein, partial [Candidatus Dadabacteria bacterium]